MNLKSLYLLPALLLAHSAALAAPKISDDPFNKRRLKPFSLFQTTPYKERPFQTTLNVV